MQLEKYPNVFPQLGTNTLNEYTQTFSRIELRLEEMFLIIEIDRDRQTPIDYNV